MGGAMTIACSPAAGPAMLLALPRLPHPAPSTWRAAPAAASAASPRVPAESPGRPAAGAEMVGVAQGVAIAAGCSAAMAQRPRRTRRRRCAAADVRAADLFSSRAKSHMAEGGGASLQAVAPAAESAGSRPAQDGVRARASATWTPAAAASASTAATRDPPRLVAAAVVGQKKAVSSSKVVQRLFLQGAKASLAPNVWYESPETTTSSQSRVWQHWQVRPTRQIERICEGTTSCGCTWRQLDGRRGASFFRLDGDGKVSFIREIIEPAGWAKFKENNLATLQPAFGVMNTIKNAFNVFDSYLVVEDKNRERPRPRFGLDKPKSRRAGDIVKYLWEEAQYAEDGMAADRLVSEYSENAVYEDLTYVDEVWPRGKEAIFKYESENLKNAPQNLTFVLDEVSDGDMACVALWHTEFAGQKSPRGVSYYELDSEGKISYVRASYDLAF